MIAAAGRRRVEATNRPGLEKALREEKVVSTIAMHDPAPTIAANADTLTTSFKRIDSVPLSCFLSATAGRRLALKAPEEYHSQPSSGRRIAEVP
jgi:hypothetical protein